MTLGQNIQTARRRAGLSQEALAAKIGVSRQALGKWETDTALPGLENLRQLSVVLGVGIDALLGQDAAPGPRPPEPAGKTSGPAADGPGALPDSPPGSPNEPPPLPEDPPMTLERMKALLDARDAAEARRRRLWGAAGAALLGALALAAVLLVRRYNGAMNELSARVGGLQSQVSALNGQVSGYQQQLTDTIAQASGNLAEWRYEVVAYDRDGNLTLEVTAAPRELVSGAGARFLLDTDTGTLTAGAEARDGGFAARFELSVGALTAPPMLRVQWLLPDGTVQNDPAGTLDALAAQWPPRLKVLPRLGGTTIGYRLEAGGLTLNCYPIDVDFAMPDWMEAQSAEVRLLIDGEIRDRAELLFTEAVWAGDDAMARPVDQPLHLQGTFTMTLNSDHAPYPYAGGAVALQAAMTDALGNEWLSEPLALAELSR